MNIFEAEAGENIFASVGRVTRKLRAGGWNYGFLTFNGIKLTVYPDSQLEDMECIYRLKCRLQQLGENV